MVISKRWNSLVVSRQVLFPPSRWVIVLVPIVEAFKPLGSLLDVVVRSLLRDRLGDDSPLVSSAFLSSTKELVTLTPFLSRSLSHWGDASVVGGAVTWTCEKGFPHGILGGALWTTAIV
jgi:hypothetical protein